MPQLGITCPSCKGHKLDFVEHFAAYSIYRCQSCTLEFCNPMKAMSAREYETAEGYDKLRLLGESNQDSVLWWGHRQFLSSAHIFLGKNPSPRLFDIGCGTGAFVNFAIKKGYDAYGVDFDRASVDVALRTTPLKERIFHCDTKDIQKAVGSIGKFDVVTFFEVLEHVDDIHSFMDQVRSLLTANGLIALYVPLANRWSLSYQEREPADYPPNHLTRWTEKALRILMKESGFDVIKVYESPVSFGLYGLVSRTFGKRTSVADTTVAAVAPGLSATGAVSKFFNFAVKVKQIFFMPILSAIGLKGDRVLLIAKKHH